MPERRKGEKLSKYVNRCIPIVKKENSNLTQDQALGKCYGMGKSFWKRKKNAK